MRISVCPLADALAILGNAHQFGSASASPPDHIILLCRPFYELTLARGDCSQLIASFYLLNWFSRKVESSRMWQSRGPVSKRRHALFSFNVNSSLLCRTKTCFFIASKFDRVDRRLNLLPPTFFVLHSNAKCLVWEVWFNNNNKRMARMRALLVLVDRRFRRNYFASGKRPLLILFARCCKILFIAIAETCHEKFVCMCMHLFSALFSAQLNWWKSELIETWYKHVKKKEKTKRCILALSDSGKWAYVDAAFLQ